jgi:hypothetical protein
VLVIVLKSIAERCRAIARLQAGVT